jgi:hypothetical protein
MQRLPRSFEELMTQLHLDFVPAHRQPTPWRLGVASFVAILGSLVADWALVALGTTLFPRTVHYTHFQFGDYATLTIIGVAVACVGWPIVARVSLTPQWIFVRLAVVVTIVLLAPDVFIWLVQHQSAAAVFTLVLMHFAIAVVTYVALTRLAPAGPDANAPPRSQ